MKNAPSREKLIDKIVALYPLLRVDNPTGKAWNYRRQAEIAELDMQLAILSAEKVVFNPQELSFSVERLPMRGIVATDKNSDECALVTRIVHLYALLESKSRGNYWNSHLQTRLADLYIELATKHHQTVSFEGEYPVRYRVRNLTKYTPVEAAQGR